MLFLIFLFHSVSISWQRCFADAVSVGRLLQWRPRRLYIELLFRIRLCHQTDGNGQTQANGHLRNGKNSNNNKKKTREPNTHFRYYVPFCMRRVLFVASVVQLKVADPFLVWTSTFWLVFCLVLKLKKKRGANVRLWIIRKLLWWF